jgi:hypothetical protein
MIAQRQPYSYHAEKKSMQKALQHVTDVYIFSVFCVRVLIIRYDKMVSHMMPTCAFVFVIKARDPGKDLPYHLVDMCTL